MADWPVQAVQGKACNHAQQPQRGACLVKVPPSPCKSADVDILTMEIHESMLFKLPKPQRGLQATKQTPKQSFNENGQMPHHHPKGTHKHNPLTSIRTWLRSLWVQSATNASKSNPSKERTQDTRLTVQDTVHADHAHLLKVLTNKISKRLSRL